MFRRLSIAVLILSVVALSVAALGAQAAPDDDVVVDVLRMLKEGVESLAIVDWLSRDEREVPRLEPDDMIVLSKAGASQELVQALLARSSGQSPPPVPKQPTQPGDAGMDPAGAPGDGLAGLAITLHYRSQADIDDRNKRWAMLVYLDGKPLAWATSNRDSVQASRRVPPGRHVIHVLRESHLDWKSGWRHESYVNLQPIEFTLEPGEGWHLSIDWVMKTLRFSNKGPLNWSLTRWNVGVAGDRKAGELLDEWPRLCEDVEANIPEGKTKPPGWVKRDLQGCVRWSELWADVPGAPDRADVRKELEAVDYRPPLI